jgi:flagellar protein FliS
MLNSEYYRHSLESEVLSASPVELVCILYRAAIDSIVQARVHLRDGEIESRSRSISKASAIITELATSLDTGAAGNVGRSLAELYDYLQRRLTEANLKQADEPLAEAEKLLSTLLDGWMNCSSEPGAEELDIPLPVYTEVAEYTPVAYTY